MSLGENSENANYLRPCISIVCASPHKKGLTSWGLRPEGGQRMIWGGSWIWNYDPESMGQVIVTQTRMSQLFCSRSTPLHLVQLESHVWMVGESRTRFTKPFYPQALTPVKQSSCSDPKNSTQGCVLIHWHKENCNHWHWRNFSEFVTRPFKKNFISEAVLSTRGTLITQVEQAWSFAMSALVILAKTRPG